MSIENGIIQKPVSVKEVRDVLQETTFSVGGLCKSNKINKWAKYKPFNSTRLSFQQDSDVTVRDRDEALINITGEVHYGLKINSRSPGCLVTDQTTNKKAAYAEDTPYYCELYNYDISQDEESFLYKLAKGELDDWVYKERVAPFRLSDFINYKHDSVSPLPTVASANKYIPKDNTRKLNAQLPDVSDVPGNLHLGDILLANGVTLNKFYIGVLFYNESCNNCFVITSSTPLSDSSLTETNQKKYTEIPIRQQGLRDEKFFMKTFLCSVHLDDSVNLRDIENAYFVGCGMTKAAECNIYISNKVIMKVEILKPISVDGKSQIHLMVSIENKSGIPVYVTGAEFANGQVSTEMSTLNSDTNPLGPHETRTYNNTNVTSLDIGTNPTFRCKVGTAPTGGELKEFTGGEGAYAEWEIETT